MVDERRYPDMWVDPEDDPRESDDQPRGERAVVADYLRHYRLTLEMKCEGLDAEQMARRSVPPSTMSLLGLVRHMAHVEHEWNRRWLGGQDVERLYVGDTDDPVFDDAVADEDMVAEAWASWRREVAHAQEVMAGLDDLGATIEVHEDQVEIREILVHMVEEYARHLGHADLLRECIDGRTGQ